MTKFKAKNSHKSTFFHAAFPSKYKREAFLANNSLGPIGIVDFTFAERNLYGRVDENLNVVVPKRESLKTVTSLENPTGVVLMNFVADQFADFQLTFERALNGGKIRPNDNFLSSPRAFGTYQDPIVAYETYLSNVMTTFQNVFLNKKNTISLQDYLKEFMAYIEQVTPTFPLTYTAWHRSKNSNIFHSGLAISLSGLAADNDELKEQFIESENFPYFLNVCNNFGFSISKNSPWIIVADLASPSSLRYHETYGLSSISEIFSENFVLTSTLDIEYIKRNLFFSYNRFVDSNPYEKEFAICNNKMKKSNIFRNNINLDKYNNIYNNKYFIEYYNNIRYFEEDTEFSISDRNKFSENAKKIEKTFDISRAIGYINEQYRSVYKNKPGGLNSILRKNEESDSVLRGTSVKNTPSGGNGGSSSY